MQHASASQQVDVFQAIGALQAQLHDLQRREADRAAGSASRGLELEDQVLIAIPAHLQLSPAEAAQRKRIVGKYPKTDDLPRALSDTNGLASKMLGDSRERKYLLTVLPGVQRDALECTRVAATAWHVALSLPDPVQRANYLLEAVKDLAVLSVDTAQRAADTQIRGIFEAAGHKGALTFVRTSPDAEVDIDVGDHNIIQACHVDAVKEMSGFAKDIKYNSRNGGGNNTNRNARGGGNGHSGGGKGGNNYYRGGQGGSRGSYNNSGQWRGQGNGGRGRGNYNHRGNNNNKNNNNNNNNNGSNNNDP